MTKKGLLVVIAGPTAVGKTDVAIQLAKYFSASIISADSRQFYREMEVGTAKPTNEELQDAKHHFINSHSIHDHYDAGKFAEDVNRLLPQLFQENDIVIMVGGSGLYIQAVCDGLDEMPKIDPAIRSELNLEFENHGLNPLLEELKICDIDYFNVVDQNNPQRIIRGLEIMRSTGLTYSSFRTSKKNIINRSYNVLKLGLTMPRENLYSRIDSRMDQMISKGLFEEAKELYVHKELNALQTVGYKEIFDFFDDAYDREEAIRLLKRNSRRYAKRQMTWFKSDQEFEWFSASEITGMKDIISTQSILKP